jgi:hypothetical protein
VQRRQVHRIRPGAGVKDLCSALKQLPLPFGDLVGMQLELLAQLGQGAVFPQGRQGYLRFERRIVGAAGAPTRCLLFHQKLLFVRPLSVRLYTRSFHL